MATMPSYFANIWLYYLNRMDETESSEERVLAIAAKLLIICVTELF